MHAPSRMPGFSAYSQTAFIVRLRSFNVAHVFNAWTRMPEIHRQIARDDAFTADFTVARALLRYGRSYESAVAQFEPYDRIQETNPEGREALKDLVQRSITTKRSAFIFVNNRFEGNAPGTIQAITGEPLTYPR